jgi:ADP-heptose:LPS heptosyltransferase
MVRRNRLFKCLDFCLAVFLSPLYLFFTLFPRRPKALARPGDILISKLCCFGDSVLSLLSIQALKRRYPAARVTVLASQRTAAIFERFPAVDAVVVLPVSGVRGVREIIRISGVIRTFARLIKSHREIFLDYDLYYRFTTVLGLFCGRRMSAGFATVRARTRFYHYGVPRARDREEWRCFFDILKPLDVTPSFALPLRFRPAPAAQEKADALTNGLPSGTQCIGIIAGSSPNWPEKKWPLERFHQLMLKLDTKRQARYFLFGIKEELTEALELAERYKGNGIVNLVGRTTFPELAAWLSKMALVVSNDTGPMHLAALLGVPTVGIFGPTDHRKWTPPGRFTAVYDSLECRPCYYLSRMPACTHLDCLRRLAVEKVWAAAEALLAKGTA